VKQLLLEVMASSQVAVVLVAVLLFLPMVVVSVLSEY